MKNLLAILCLFALIATGTCKNDTDKTEAEAEVAESGDALKDGTDYKTYKGEFIYTADGAVLMGKNFIYGVEMDMMSEILSRQVAPVKKDSTDMVAVLVRGEVKPKEKGAEGWDEVLTIKEIVAVNNRPSEADIKIEEKKED